MTRSVRRRLEELGCTVHTPAQLPVACALASDTLIAVVRALVLARHKEPDVTVAAAAPGRRGRSGQGGGAVPRKAAKTARFLDQVIQRHGVLAAIPLHRSRRSAPTWRRTSA